MNAKKAAEKIIVALDVDEVEALDLADKLAGTGCWMKVGMTLYYQAGAAIVSKLVSRGFKIFLDLKLCDIPHQIEGAAREAMASGAELLSVHSLGGEEMLRAALRGARVKNDQARVIAITILTSLDNQSIQKLGIDASASEEAERLGALALSAGVDGLVCSGQEAARLRTAHGAGPLIVCPGVRLPSNEMGDQARVVTPAKAIADGASMIVVGRPITASEDPLAAFESIVSDLVENA